MVVYALSFLTGVLLVQQFPILPDSRWLAAGAISIGICVWRHHWRLLFFLGGVAWAVAFASARLTERLPEQLENIAISVTGYVSDLPKHDDKQSRFDFIVTAAPYRLPAKLRLSWYSPTREIKAGQYWSFTVKLKRPHGTLNPGCFDYERWLFTEGIGAAGYVKAEPPPTLLAQSAAWHTIAVWRQHIVTRLEQTIKDAPGLALIKALSIGDDNSISKDQWQLFRNTGTTHLVVISGSHIGLIAGLVYYLALRLWAKTGILSWPPQKIAALSALLTAVVYSALAGFSIPTQRALVMLAIAMAAIFLQRHTRPFNTLALALLTVLLYDPLAVLSAGFWLSFVAVGIIIYTLAGRLAKPSYMPALVKINWATTLALSPLLLFFFQQVSLIAPLANLIAVPIIGLLVVPLALLAILFLFLAPPLAQLLLFPVDLALQGLLWLLTKLAGIPMSAVSHPTPPGWALAFTVPGILLLLAPQGIPGRWLGLALFLPLAFPIKDQLKAGEIKLTLLDVGQGLSAAVQTAHHVLVFDTGAKFPGGGDIGQSVILPFLQNQGIGGIDALIISHGDNDHIGGADSLIHGIAVAKVMTSVPRQLAAYAPVTCSAGQSWNWDQVGFTVLSPPLRFTSENDNSCVVKIESVHGTVLLTGDIEAEAENRLVQNYADNLKAEILIAPHHGSQTSSTNEFLQTVRPDYVLISAGYKNQFGHPHKDVLARYRNIEAHWLNTANSGAITIDMKSGLPKVSAFRETDSKYWNFR